MRTTPRADLLSAGRANNYGPQDWVDLAVSAMSEAVKGTRGHLVLTVDEALALVTGVQALGELFPEVVSNVSRGLLPALRHVDQQDGFSIAQMISASSSLSGAVAGLSRGGGWLDYAHEALTGFRLQRANELATVTEQSAC